MHDDEEDLRDPAMAPVLEAGGGVSEGFEMAERELIEHASHGDWGGTARIAGHASHIDEEFTSVDYGEGDSETKPDL